MRSYYFFISALLFTLLTSNSYATITINSVTNASIYRPIDSSINRPIIAGGLGGADSANGCASKTGDATCDSCGTGQSSPCNNARIYDSLVLNISITTDGSGGTLAISKDEDSTTFTTTVKTTIGDKGTGTISILWSELCSKLNGTTCSGIAEDGSISEQLYIGVDTDGNDKLYGEDAGNIMTVDLRVYNPDTTAVGCDEGICDITLQPGDQKIYITSAVGTTQNATIANGVSIEKLRVMHSTESFSATNASATVRQYSDFTLDSDGKINDATVKDLTNDTRYVVRFANVDTTGNVLFIQTSSIYSAGGCSSENDLNSESTNCLYTATPSEVIGLLLEDLNCFITTAAYGSLMADKVKTFREFRNKILIPTTWGRKLVQFYYSFGPRMAQKISGNEALKTLARVFLWPLWLFSWISLKWGLMTAFLISALSLSGATWLFYRSLKWIPKWWVNS